LCVHPILGTHEEIVRLARALQAAKDRRMAMADRVRKMHIQIADNMYDYELQEAAAAYEVSRTNVNSDVPCVREPNQVILCTLVLLVL
jgi:hypothetical protein